MWRVWRSQAWRKEEQKLIINQMDVLVRICIALDCSMDDIVEIERTKDGD